MARTNSLSNFLTDIITALKNKLETTELISASEVDTKIKNIQGKVKANGKRENWQNIALSNL